MSDEFEHDVNWKGRVNVHLPCGGLTGVDGMDYVHVCDPFWYCRATYCSQCSDHFPMDEFRWMDTGEKLLDYRNRLRAQTPLVLQMWRYSLGFLMGGCFGAAGGMIAGLIGQAMPHQIGLFGIVGGLIGACACYLLGTFVLNRLFGVDYRRMR